MGERERTPACRLWLLVGALAVALLTVALDGSAGAQAREILHRTPPDYPPLAARMKVSGTVTVVATIDTTGSVLVAHATTGHALLRQAAEKAVMQSKFVSGAKPTETTIDVQFQITTASTR